MRNQAILTKAHKGSSGQKRSAFRSNVKASVLANQFITQAQQDKPLVKWQGYRLVAAISFVVLAISILGCGDGGPYRETVSGTVTFDGQPLESGEILFMPSAGGGTPEGGPITAGKFEFRAIPGAKRIEISATREDAKPAADGLPNYVSFIPDRYNRKSTLSESVEEGGNNVFTFDLKSGN